MGDEKLGGWSDGHLTLTLSLPGGEGQAWKERAFRCFDRGAGGGDNGLCGLNPSAS
jgi:hypothetical protein